MEKARALTYWLRRNIRYVSAGEKHDYTPHLPAAGPAPTATATARTPASCSPSCSRGRHPGRAGHARRPRRRAGAGSGAVAVGHARHPAGDHRRQAALDRHHARASAGWDFLPRDDRDRLCYVVDDKGDPPGAHAAADGRGQPHRADDGRLDRRRRLVALRARRRSTHGSAALAQRDAWLEVPAGERRRQVTSRTAGRQQPDAPGRACASTRQTLRDFDQPVHGRDGLRDPRPLHRRRRPRGQRHRQQGVGQAAVASTSTTTARRRSTCARRSSRGTATSSTCRRASRWTACRATRRCARSGAASR